MIENLERFGILSPSLKGRKENYPSILMTQAYISDGEDIIFEDGELKTAYKRAIEFYANITAETQLLIPNPIIGYKQLDVSGKLIVFTKCDVVYMERVSANLARAVFLNPIYTTGQIDSKADGGNGTTILTFSGSLLSANAKIGDYIQVVNNTDYTSDQTWYPVTAVGSNTELTILGTPTMPAFPVNYTLRKIFNGGNDDYWSAEECNGDLVVSNFGVDNIHKWTGTGQLADAGIAYKARYIVWYEQRLLLLYTIESSTPYPYRGRFSGIGLPYTLGASDTQTFYEGTGEITGGHVWGSFLFVSKRRSWIKQWLVASTEIFAKTLVTDEGGTRAFKSVVVRKDGIRYYDDGDNTFRYFDGFNTRIMSNDIKTYLSGINYSYGHIVQGIWCREKNQVIWAIPYGTNTKNTKICAMSLEPDLMEKWIIINHQARCFGYYPAQTGQKVTLCGGSLNDADVTGIVFRVYGAATHDAGVTGQTKYAVFNIDCGDLMTYKRIYYFTLIARKDASCTITFDYKPDGATAWGSLSPGLSLNSAGDIAQNIFPVDLRAKAFQIKIKSTLYYPGILGLIFHYEKDGQS